MSSTDTSSSAKSSASGDSNDVTTTLYFGNLHPYVVQKSLEDLCSYFGQVEAAKVIKDKTTNTSAGYGFVKFMDRRAAEAALQALNGKGYLGQELRVNWALPKNHKEDTTQHFHIFVGDLGSDVTDAILYNTFCTVGQCSDARVMWDHATGRSKGYGFVSFRRKDDAENAIEKMQGRQIGSRRVRCGWAQHKQDENSPPPDYESVDRADPSNTNVYVGNIPPEWSEVDLTSHFSIFGPIAEVKLHKKGGYGFVKFELHVSAVKAIVDMHGRDFGGRVLKCSWGKNMSLPNSNSPVAGSSSNSPYNALAGANGNMVASLAAAAVAASSPGGANAPLMLPPAVPQLPPQLMAASAGAGAGAGNIAQLMAAQQLPNLGAAGLMGHANLYNNPGLSQVIPMALATQMMMIQGLQAQAQNTTGLNIASLAPAVTTGGLGGLDPHNMGAYYNGMYFNGHMGNGHMLQQYK
mmetsp:Transcript_39058/g.86881  ORF Transcript_39058/g.86881 Transcript_39058/m.86881 type:complete len:464 (+) Transcript_39058:198-1589(+)|eukprot:CAMPEP_0202894882 /NCGR_PEP_ID=MMETSP1392-20130828/4175_1 /ASSEMBLY_ACC=CAM_ASM_000868 /TAXON_ID=225041 /ORGANISM="Chlamydomonas chlamydogama, Strain SAG 11-48b" /LENGTH=463 /DNA_ID=CAMNT_0049579703 /DNA_START=88 /DNA_END=1479 /DNA_ORIENTATION=+